MDCLTDLLYSEKYCFYRSAAAVVGVLVLARGALKVLCSLWTGLRAYFLAPLGIGRANLLKYGKWAVVTGASEGIGRGYALELARRGLNVALMSRSKEKLDKVAKEIEEKYGKKTLVVPVDFSGGLEIYTDIANQISHLDVGVLVNNVGMSYEVMDKFANVSAERLFKLVHINCQPVVQMSRAILPKMVEQGGGYIINLSSASAMTAFPQLMVYSATKVFVNYVSDGLRKEYGGKGITVQTVMPFLVSTSMTANARASFFVRTPVSFTRAALATVGIQNSTFGCFPHAVQGILFESLPASILDRVLNKEADKSRARFLRKKEKQKKN